MNKINSLEGKRKKRTIIIYIFAAAVMISAVVFTAVYKSRKMLTVSGEDISAYAENSSHILSFARSLGYSCHTVSERKVIIPTDFSDILEKYNDIQRTMGTDLRSYRGKACRLFTLALKDGRYMHLICCEDRIIAGDIDNGTPDGIFYPLTKKNPPDIDV